MAVAKMNLVQIVGLKKDIETVLKDLVLTETLHSVEIREMLQQPELLEIKKEEKIYNVYLRKIENVLEQLHLPKTFLQEKAQEPIKIEKYKGVMQKLEEKIKVIQKTKEDLSKEKEYMINIRRHLAGFGEAEIQIEKLTQMEFINVHFGKIHIDNYKRLFQNIENLPFIVKSVYQEGQVKWVFVFALSHQEERAERILSSLYFEEFKLPEHFIGTPKSIVKNIDTRLEEIELLEEEQSLKLKKVAQENKNILFDLYSKVVLLEKVEALREESGETEKFFYLTGWMPASAQSILEEYLMKFPQLIIYKQDAESVQLKEEMQVPTKLENPNWLKPFEGIVKMYGIPRYNEIDPTILISITFLLFYGLMFGDVGQGLILAVSGFLLYRFTSIKEIGSVIIAAGGMSTIFGFLYGDFFGYEDIIPSLWVHPMHRINFMLIFAVGLGIVMISISIAINIYKHFKQRDMMTIWFDRNGILGLAFYWLSIFTVFYFVKTGQLWANIIVILLLLLTPLVLMFFKEPLEHYIKEKHFKAEEGYYVHAFFEVYEILLGFFSNTLSFIRVSAFALNHVGLMMAVFILAEMTKGKAGSLFTIIIGNLFVIGLEGLIVGIQALRLNYYELFSRFYDGDGQDYHPIKLREEA